jgi:hypothetical protein
MITPVAASEAVKAQVGNPRKWNCNLKIDADISLGA